MSVPPGAAATTGTGVMGLGSMPSAPKPPFQAGHKIIQPGQQGNTLRDLYSPWDNSALANTFARLWAYGQAPWEKIGGTGTAKQTYESGFYQWLNSLDPQYGEHGGITGFGSELPSVGNLPYVDPRKAVGMDYGALAAQLDPQPTGDPFMEFLLNQLGIAGLNQPPQLSAENQRRVRFGREPLPQLQPPPPPPLFDTTLNQLRGVDSLLAQLLSGIQSQPAPPVFNTGMRLF